MDRKLARVDWVYKRDGITLLFCKLAAYVVAHTVALKLMYPGSITVINWAMSKSIIIIPTSATSNPLGIHLIFYIFY